MTVLIFEIMSAFLVLWLVFFVALVRSKHRESVTLSISVSPQFAEAALEKCASHLQDLGFVFVGSFDKGQYGLWPMPVELYAHNGISAFAEISALPSGEIQVRYVTTFPDGFLVTTVGERQVTFRLLSSADVENWEPGDLSSVWNAHVKFLREYEARHKCVALSAIEEHYIKYLNVRKFGFQRALEKEKLVPRTVVDYLLLGCYYLHEHRIMEALEMFQGAINLEPDRPQLHHIAGKACFSVRNYPAASQYFYETLDLNPQQKESYLLLAESQLRQGKKKAAYEILRRAKEFFPDEIEISVQLGGLAVDLGDLEVAQANLGPFDGVAAAPSPFLYQALNHMHAKLGNAKKAKEYAKLARIWVKNR